MLMCVLYIVVVCEYLVYGFGVCNVKGSSGILGKLCYKFYVLLNLELKIGDYVMVCCD